MAISTPDELREHLQLAIGVELSTVPPYLYAMYSIADQTSDAALLIRSVVAEEMLHAALAANMLLAVGGDPDFASAALIPSYPSDVPHHKPRLTLNLKPCSQQQVEELFLVIEQPESHHTIPDDAVYDSLGQFYHAIENGITSLSQTHDLFANPQTERQMGDPSYYAPVAFDAEDSGGLKLIEDAASADEAIHVIVHQGEGVSDEKWADPLHQELTHYYKFLQIAEGRAPLGMVRPAPVNPRLADYPPHVQPVARLFNAAYRYLYLTMDAIFQPNADRDALVGRLYRIMSGVLSPVAHHLFTLSIGNGAVAAPTFEIHEYETDDPISELRQLAESAGRGHPQLAAVAETLAGI
jgi:hypothetical protein